MRRKLSLMLVVGLCGMGSAQALTPGLEQPVERLAGRTFYVRQTVGDDLNDGLSAATAWRSISKLSDAMRAGDTAYVGPGLYRDQIIVRANGTWERPIRFIGDSMGLHTGDPPGVVMITGAEPVDEEIFQAYSAEGVYLAHFPAHHVAGVVEMDGDQFRYKSVLEPVPDVPYLEVVIHTPASFFYDRDEQVLYLHTSDGKHPSTHELELVRRTGGISMTEKHFIIIEGFTFRHTFDAGILFSTGSGDAVALNNVSYGSRQGIRVNHSTNVVISGNTLFRNENCGVYFLNESVNGLAIDNLLYENIKGVRWSSQSNHGLAVGNTAFDNHEAGISVESTAGTQLTGNRLVNNGKTQLLGIKSTYLSEANCFQSGGPGQWLADLYFNNRYGTLTEYQRASGQDLSSSEGGCGPMPGKVDVHKLHAESTAYAEKARKLLNKP